VGFVALSFPFFLHRESLEIFDVCAFFARPFFGESAFYCHPLVWFNVPPHGSGGGLNSLLVVVFPAVFMTDLRPGCLFLAGTLISPPGGFLVGVLMTRVVSVDPTCRRGFNGCLGFKGPFLRATPAFPGFFHFVRLRACPSSL